MDVVWLNPIFESPNKDNGYDISDYRAIMAECGNMDDFDELLREVHARGLKLVLDLVVNHTSDQHRWFMKPGSRGKILIMNIITGGRKKKASLLSVPVISRQAPGGITGKPILTNLHYFSREQPDLNWET